MKTVTLIGTGAVGALYGWRLAQGLGMDQIQVLAEGERKKRYEQEGFFLNGEQVFFPIVTPGQAKPTDLVIIATKNHQLKEAIKAIENAVGKDTAIMSLLNGTESETLLEHAYGPKPVLYAFAVGLSSRHERNHIDFTEEGKIVFGEKDNSKSERIRSIVNLFEQSHIKYLVPEDIRLELWKKFMLNTAFNTLSSICLATYGDFKAESLRTLAWKASKEVQAVAKAEGIILTDAMIEANYKTITSLGTEGKTSMFQDMEAGRKTENQWFCGTVVDLGQRHNIPTPVCETLSLLVEGCEQARFRHL
ncbi:2-dehydropantoate 2-reductase [Sphaerochaeta pleomorpha str. Grapes]|uniref:2-dehydropantoate 2-reductase n=1 Tax=Sphaerochaeta pleomorpha (strain ATCC BAA-1885 / DSM 22778 / Grapes) TaxID=158190 RepID=G8QSS2_SPHPG|nr:ketopantoate reductase family protein [Sphaerochaeta pleomorpha]AEV30104.1 2-dehydropantoate 2-reductase [Sphaerochaeta pleomorpha str. Grapes]